MVVFPPTRHMEQILQISATLLIYQLTLSVPRTYLWILLCLTPDDFTRQRGSLELCWCRQVFHAKVCLHLTKKAFKNKPYYLVIQYHSVLLCQILWWYSPQQNTCDQFYNSVLRVFIYQLKVTILSLRAAEKCTTQKTISGWQND